MKFIVETIAFNIQSCTIAQAAGAHRIELCSGPAEGGTTPSYGFIKAARALLNIALYPIIRPRGGDFFYTEYEFDMMMADVKMCKNLGCDGVVIGMLHDDATINKIKCAQLVNAAYPLGVTFHRAFDRVIDVNTAMEDIIEIGCERILTSGGYPNVMQGLQNINELITLAADRITIMPGSGVRANNIIEVALKTGATEFHSSARNDVQTYMKILNENMNENLIYTSIDEIEIKNMIGQLKMIN